MSTKYMDLKEFHEFGFLQEVNRRFFHPLGLALELLITEDPGDDGSDAAAEYPQYELNIQDHRHDPEGVVYAHEPDNEKATRVYELLMSKLEARGKLLDDTRIPGVQQVQADRRFVNRLEDEMLKGAKQREDFKPRHYIG